MHGPFTVFALTSVFVLAGCMASTSARAPDGSAGALFQVIVNVNDMSRQVEFYRDVMGLPIIYPQGVDDYSKEPFVRFDTGGAYLVLHIGRKTRNAGDEPRLSFMTPDLEGFRSRLLEQGVAVAEIRSPAPGVLVADARDPEGNAFHLEARVASHGEEPVPARG